MKFSFTAKIYITGINPCVDVPLRITEKMPAVKGYIPIKGKINKHAFIQTLVPVKNAEYRLHVNGPMLKGAKAELGDTVKFTIEQNFNPPSAENIAMPKDFEKQLVSNKLLAAFKALTPSRRKEILRYLNNLRTKEALGRNIEKIIRQLKEN
jgi:hypothetical protein